MAKKTKGAEVDIPLQSTRATIDRIMGQAQSGTTFVTHDATSEDKAKSLRRQKYSKRDFKITKRGPH